MMRPIIAAAVIALGCAGITAPSMARDHGGFGGGGFNRGGFERRDGFEHGRFGRDFDDRRFFLEDRRAFFFDHRRFFHPFFSVGVGGFGYPYYPYPYYYPYNYPYYPPGVVVYP